MNFQSDLEHILKQQFDEHNISYKENWDVNALVAHYFEMLKRRIAPIPRKVHFSKEILDSLGQLSRQADLQQHKEAAEAWGVVFDISYLLKVGENVNAFLSKNITRAASLDGLLWDFGMHHFHLSKKVKQSGFIKRSDYLLFAIVTQDNVYCVDVRPHPQQGDLGWVRQDLLIIVYANWPELIKAKILRGVEGTLLTDEQKHELRRKNTNTVMQIGDLAFAPMGGGMTTAGTSVLCQMQADRFLNEIQSYQSYLETQPAEIRAALQDNEVNIAGNMDFKLVLLSRLGWSDEKVRSLTGTLNETGVGIVEVKTHTFIDMNFVEQ